MITLMGKGVYGGIAIGQLSFFRRSGSPVPRYSVKDVDGELRRFQQAKSQALGELRELYEKALRDIGESGAQIFEIHGMMLEDDDYNDSVENTVRTERVNAEYAVSTAAENFSMVFSSMDDPYMQARAADVRDISMRLVRALSGKPSHREESSEEARIICADDLAPSETMQLDRSSVSAFVTAEGSVNSHTAILARTMGIPAVVDAGEELMQAESGTLAIVDGFTGRVYLNPDEETLGRMRRRLLEDRRAKSLLQKYKGMDNVTKDGRRIDVFANIQGLREVGAALLNDAGGIGLFRSEFLYLDRTDFPTEEEQFSVYKTVLQSMGGKKVVIRTLDVGADKQIPYFDLPREENPALGFRAVRICLARESIFKTQLRAILRASAFGTVSLMIPMIVSAEEVRDCRRLLEECKEELRQEGKEFDSDPEFGIMIETPAAAIMSDELAAEVDFFSVGTNDLTQYTLAADRQNPLLDSLCERNREPVLRLIERSAEAIHQNGGWIGICGELAADLRLTQRFADMRIDELSVSAPYLLGVRERVIECK